MLILNEKCSRKYAKTEINRENDLFNFLCENFSIGKFTVCEKCVKILGNILLSIRVEPAMRSHPCDTGKVAFKSRWLLIGGLFAYKMPFWGMTKWPPIGGWLLIRVAAHSRLYFTTVLM